MFHSTDKTFSQLEILMAQHRPHQVEGLVDVLSRGFSGKCEEMVGGGEMPVRAWDLTSTHMTSAREVRVTNRIFPKSEQLLSLGLMLTLYYNSEIHAEQETKTCSRVSSKPFILHLA